MGIDLPRAITREEAKTRAADLREQYWETSAVADRPGVQALFDHLVNTVPTYPAPTGMQLEGIMEARHWSCCA